MGWTTATTRWASHCRRWWLWTCLVLCWRCRVSKYWCVWRVDRLWWSVRVCYWCPTMG